MSRRGGRGGAAAIVLSTILAAMPAVASAEEPRAAFGDATVTWIAVSPAFERTGLVVAMASCGNRSCLWASHDGGVGWKRAKAKAWRGGRIAIATDRHGRDVIYAESSSHVQRSDDGGETWKDIGGPGMPSVSPTYARDGRVVVAGFSGEDYMLRGTNARSIRGSGGRLSDLFFLIPPGYPDTGRFSPALLAAADKKTGLPVIQRCEANFTCRGDTQLVGSSTFSAPGMELFAAEDYARSGVVFARTGRGIYKSLDGGSTFVPLNVGERGATATATAMFALSPGYRESGTTRIAYVAVIQAWIDAVRPQNSRSQGGVYRTSDGGATWRRLGSPSPLDDGATAIAVAPNGRLFAAFVSTRTGHGGVLCSADGGRSWDGPCPGGGVEAAGSSTATSDAACRPPCSPGTGPAGSDSSSRLSFRSGGSGDGESRGGGNRTLFLVAGLGFVAALAGGSLVRKRLMKDRG